MIYIRGDYMEIYGKGKHSKIVKNEYIKQEDYAILKIANGKTFKVDLDDIEKLSKFTWGCNKKGYAQTKVNNKILQLHRIVMNCKKSDRKIVDHVNKDISDNRKCNLRFVSHQENSFNRKPRKDSKSNFRGVYYREEKSSKWYVDIKVNYKTIHVGTFDSFEEAKQARLEAEKKYFKIGSAK